MHGWEKISSACGMGCKVFWHPWSQDEKLSYDSVNRDDNDVTDSQEPVTSEPQKPIWSDIKIGAPIVRNMSGSVGNIKTGAGYEKLSTNGLSAPIVRNKSGSVGNIKTGAGYEKLAAANGLSHSSSLAKLSEKKNSKSDLTGSVPTVSKALLNENKDLNGSRASLAEEVLHVQQMVTTV